MLTGLLTSCQETAYKHFLLPYSFGVLLSKFPSWSASNLIFSLVSYPITSRNFLLGSRGLLPRCIVTSVVSCTSTCSIPFWKYSHKRNSFMKSSLLLETNYCVCLNLLTLSVPIMFMNVSWYIHILFSVLGIFSWLTCRNRRSKLSSEIRSFWIKCINPTSFEVMSDYLCFSAELNYFFQKRCKQHSIWNFSCMLWVLFPQSFPPKIFWLDERQPNLLVVKFAWHFCRVL